MVRQGSSWKQRPVLGSERRGGGGLLSFLTDRAVQLSTRMEQTCIILHQSHREGDEQDMNYFYLVNSSKSHNFWPKSPDETLNPQNLGYAWVGGVMSQCVQ